MEAKSEDDKVKRIIYKKVKIDMESTFNLPQVKEKIEIKDEPKEEVKV